MVRSFFYKHSLCRRNCMTFLIDGHEDLAYNALSFNRDYRKSAAETRALEAGTDTPALTGGRGNRNPLQPPLQPTRLAW